ncbi:MULTISPECIES: hypothetical protein [unclassified Rhizobium]|uniref:hypothetical protein n=1 Tax=unclassified Rhizobium TaxID=2613769 RepID=UPI00167622C2|nr:MULTISPECIES: hypothetical protein [unclassified Rhizobium]
MELDAYPDLREELFRREITASLEDKGPGIPAEEVFAKLKATINKAAGHKPPTWVKVPYPS